MNTLKVCASTSTERPLAELRSSMRYVRYAKGVSPGFIAQLWDDPEALLATGRQLRRSGFRHTVLLERRTGRFVMKHYVEPTIRHAAKRTILPSRAHLTWNAAERLASLGIATPLPVALVENRRGPFRRDSFLVYPYFPGETLGDAIVRHTTAGTSNQLASFWDQLEAVWDVLRHHRISLADANTGNFIVTPAGELVVIDLDKTRFHLSASRAKWFQLQTWQQLERCAANAAASAQVSPLRRVA